MPWIKAFIKSLRPKQWPKNIFLFAALVFDRKFLEREPLLVTAAGFFLLCMASSTVYLINDIADREQDRLHPTKSKRPIASGALSVPAAAAAAFLLMLLSLAASYLLSPAFSALIAVYLALNLAYSFHLKHIPIVDALIVAVFYVLRVVGGAVLISVAASPWMYVCMVLLALIISFGRRRSEIVLLEEGAANHRRVLSGYTVPLLDSFIQIVSAATLVAYSFYTFSAPNLPVNHAMMLTIPFVLYSIFRYLYLVQVENSGGAPEELILTDRPLQAGIAIWGLAAVLILYIWK